MTSTNKLLLFFLIIRCYSYKRRAKNAGNCESNSVCRQFSHFDLGADEPENHRLEELPEHAESERHLVLADFPALIGKSGAGAEGGHNHCQGPRAR